MSKCATPDCPNPRQRKHQHCAACVAEAARLAAQDPDGSKARLLAVIEREARRGLYSLTGKKQRL